LVSANGRIQASFSTMSVIGPVLAGGLAAVAPLPSLLLVDSVSYLVAAVALLLVRGSFDAPDRPIAARSVWIDVVEGVRFVFAHPVLRNISVMMMLVNLVSLTVSAQVVYFARVQLHAGNGQIGLLYSANAVGILLLALLAGPLRSRLSFRWVALGALQLQGVVTIVMGQTHLFWLVLPLFGLWQGLGVLFTINTTSLRQSVSPHHLLGRVVMTAGVLGGAVIPIGSLAGGFIIERTHDIGAVYSGIGVLVFVIPLVFSFTALGRAERYLPQTREAGERVA
jgi:MFS family permease